MAGYSIRVRSLAIWAELGVVVLHIKRNTLVPVVTVQLGEPVTLPCAFLEKYQSTTWLHWYKQSSGDTLKLIVMLQKGLRPKYGPDVSASRIKATNDDKFSNLTILRTVLQDEGMYHCAHMDWTESTWTGTYLLVKAKSGRTSNYTVVQQPTLSDPSHKVDSETLQCSVFSDSDISTCSGDPSVFWFRATSDRSFPDIIYTDGKTSENCEKRSDSQMRCFYNFSKSVNFSDAGTYYCAVATCGQILFGNGTILKRDETFKINMLVVTVICLVIYVIINIIFTCCQTQRCACQQFKERWSQRGQNFGQER
ncbi:uncharacterized protein LOC124860089 [Girardinichthys multiradiatus]|uniref:uncharacterized protein LOC124860089 n=1 Tax=Girardinichthys multiradiatus TaxID=208333 RepID=UPI001FAD0F87|nr:uncharacterized protein LOC124860089 [Girardinichthys multiradiatus]